MEDLGKLIFTGVVTLLVGLALQRLRPQVRLRFWTPHSFYFNLEKEQLELRTDSLTVQNLGRKPASSVEIIHRQRPDFFQIFPSIQYEEDETPRGEHIIRLPSLGSKEQGSTPFPRTVENRLTDTFGLRQSYAVGYADYGSARYSRRHRFGLRPASDSVVDSRALA